MVAHNPTWLVAKYPKNLKAQIRELVELGYMVTLQDVDSAQLMRKKKFSFFIALLCALAVGVGLLIYVIWYLAKRDDIIYLDLATQNTPEQQHEQDEINAGAKSVRNKRILIAVGVLLVITFIKMVIDAAAG